MQQFPAMTTQQRLDTALVALGFFPSREQARRALLAGDVEINGQRDMKPGWTARVCDTPEGAQLFRGRTPLQVTIRQKCPYVSRGGYKLAAGLDAFNLSAHDKVCLDIGASTGGFTDCLLQRGARKVYTVDCGYGQLHATLRDDARVVNYEKTNARSLTPALFDEHLDLIVADVSFISLTAIFPVMAQLSTTGTEIVVLIKPQFELGPRAAVKGVVRTSALRQVAIDKITSALSTQGWTCLGVCESPIKGPAGNHEFLAGARV